VHVVVLLSSSRGWYPIVDWVLKILKFCWSSLLLRVSIHQIRTVELSALLRRICELAYSITVQVLILFIHEVRLILAVVMAV
jgi:hypothetical protein